MPSRPESRVQFAAALAEAAAWLVPAGAFLWLYVPRVGGSLATVAAHAQVLFAIAASTLAMRCLVQAIAGRRPAAWAGAACTALVLLLLCAYYAVALVGIDAWGHVVSWSLIATYGQQATYLLDVFGPAAWGVAAALVAALVVTFAVLYRLLRRRDWTAVLVLWLGPRLAAFAALAAIVLLAVFWWRFQANPPTAAREPLALTFWPDSFESKFGRAAIAGAVGEREAYAQAHAPAGRAGTNVILIVSDALRARNMGVYGYARPTTPFLSRMESEGVARRMLRAQSVCSQSSCGLLGIASSRYVHLFPDRPLALPQVLQFHGYRTHMVLSGDHTNFYGLRTIYGHVDSYIDGSMTGGYMNDDSLVLDAVRKLDLSRTRGQFLQVHLMASHLLGRRTGGDRFGLARNYYAGMAKVRPTPQEEQAFVNFYDAGVAQADDTIRELLGILRQRGLLEDALVVVTGDHGEFVGEHGLFGHAKAVYGEVIDVPLLFLAFGRAAPLHIDERRLASQVDIAPTVLSALGLPVPEHWSGIALQAKGPTPAGREVFFQQGAEFGLVARKPDGRTWKYWVDGRSGQDQAFDLDRDPGESRNVASDMDPADRKRWRAMLLPLAASVKESLP